MKIKILAASLLGLVLFVACQHTQVANPDTVTEEELTLFTETDIDNAILQISDEVIVRPIVVNSAIPNGEIISTDSNGEEDSLTTLLDVNNLSGYVCNIINNTNGRNKWRIQSINTADESVIGLLGVKQDGRAIQSIGCTAFGNKAVFSMKTSSSEDYEVFLLDFTGTTRQAYQLTNNITNDIDVSMSSDGTTIAWQSWLGSKKVITLRQYAPDGTFNDTILEGGLPFVEPSISSDASFLTFLRIQSSSTNLLKYDFSDNSSISVHTQAGKRSLAHPSISNDGQRVAWMDGADDENFKVKDLNTNTIIEIVSNNPYLEHGFLADDGNSVVYSINRDDKAFTKVKNVDDGTTSNVGRVLSPPARYRGSVWVEADSAWSSITIGRDYTCGIKGEDAYCWGAGTFGHLGNGSTNNQTIPTLVTKPQTVDYWKILNASVDHTCGIGNDNQVYCWGAGASGRLGNGSTENKLTPSIITNPAGVSSWKYLATGGHTCAITDNDQMYCWGYGRYGQLGNGSTSNQLLPTLVTNPQSVNGWKSVSADGGHTCAIALGDQAYCWGAGNTGLLGNGSTSNKRTPIEITAPQGVSSWKAINAGSFHTCGITSDDQIYCWGGNDDGQLGIASNTSTSIPTLVNNPQGINGWTSISSGRHHTCAITNDNAVYCWGFGDSGRLGNGSTIDKLTPELVSTVDMWNLVDAGREHSCGISTINKVYCWGVGDSGRLGNGSTTNQLIPSVIINP